ncbi:MAG: hypothetical protein SGCHY_002059 [Lobulomycetales sp.]
MSRKQTQTIFQDSASLVAGLKRHIKELSMLPESDILDVISGKQIIAKQKVLALLCEKTGKGNVVTLLMDKRRAERRNEVAINATAVARAKSQELFNEEFRLAIITHLQSMSPPKSIKLDSLDIYKSRSTIVKVLTFLLDCVRNKGSGAPPGVTRPQNRNQDKHTHALSQRERAAMDLLKDLQPISDGTTSAPDLGQLAPAAAKYLEANTLEARRKDIKNIARETDIEMLRSQVSKLELENEQLLSRLRNPGSVDAKRNIMLRTRIALLERQLAAQAVTLSQLETQNETISEIHDACRSVLAASAVSKMDKPDPRITEFRKLVKKLTGRLAAAEYHPLPSKSREEEIILSLPAGHSSQAEQLLDPKLHQVYELLCRLQQCSVLSDSSNELRIVKDCKTAVVSAMETLFESPGQTPVHTSREWIKNMPVKDRRRVERYAQERILEIQ